MRVAVLSSPSHWHFRDLSRAAADKHDLFNVEFDKIFATVEGQKVEQFGVQADCIIVRTMPAGSLQQIVFRMDWLARLQNHGVTIINPPKAIEAAVDKYLSLSLLNSAGVPVPATRVAQTVPEAKQHFKELGGDVVVKPLFGSMGNGIQRLQSESEATRYFEENAESGNVIYQQQFVDHGGFDIRLLVIGERVLGMKRTNKDHWITNISKGGVGEPYSPSQAEIDLARSAAQAVGATIAGVDLMYGPESGQPLVIEVNAVPGWRTTAKVLEIDIAALILNECQKQTENYTHRT